MKLLINLVATAWLVCGSAQAAPVGPLDLSRPLPLGDGASAQSVQAKTIAPGVTHYMVRRGTANNSETWKLIGDVAENDLAAGRLAACFSSIKLPTQTAEFHIAGAPARPYRIVSGGEFASRAAATEAAKPARAAGCALYPRHSSEDSASKSGPWTIDIVAIAPQARRGQLFAVVADKDGSLRRPTSELARGAHALVGANGGFFVEKDVDGFPGQPAGISILAGSPNSAPVSMRPAVVFPNRAGAPISIVRKFDWNAALTWSDGSQTHLDGINRKVGIVRNCGRDAGEPAVHDYTCSYKDDLVYYPPGSRFVQEVQGEARFALGADGKPRQLAPGELPAAAEAMVAGRAGDSRIAQLRERAERGLTASFKASSSLFATFGSDLSAVNAGPTLLAAGAEVREDAQEGWAIDTVDDAPHKLLMHDWINRRNPRTAIGVRADGVTLLVAVDGHRHGASVGLTIEELRQLLKYLGARDAVNLDGGGSTALFIGDRLVNHPSDAAGERKIGDAVLFSVGK
jgi:hypothetical protein